MSFHRARSASVTCVRTRSTLHSAACRVMASYFANQCRRHFRAISSHPFVLALRLLLRTFLVGCVHWPAPLSAFPLIIVNSYGHLLRRAGACLIERVAICWRRSVRYALPGIPQLSLSAPPRRWYSTQSLRTTMTS